MIDESTQKHIVNIKKERDAYKQRALQAEAEEKRLTSVCPFRNRPGPCDMYVNDYRIERDEAIAEAAALHAVYASNHYNLPDPSRAARRALAAMNFAHAYHEWNTEDHGLQHIDDTESDETCPACEADEPYDRAKEDGP
jgi:hypothetical protein